MTEFPRVDSSDHSFRWWAALAGLALVYSVAHFVQTGLWQAWQVNGGDALSVFPGPLVARRFDLFAETPAMRMGPSWNYGPVMQFVTYPLGFFPPLERASHIWLVANYALLGVSFAVWFREFDDQRIRWALLVLMAVVWLNYFPLLQAISGREVEILELAAISLSFLALRRGRDVLGGGLLGIAVMTKFLPAIFLPYLAIKRRWRALGACVVIIAVIAIAAQATLGFERSLTFSLASRAADWSGCAFPVHAENQSLVDVVQRMFTTGIDPASPFVDLRYERVTRVLGTSLQGLLLVAMFWVLWRRRRADVCAWEFSLLLIVMILVPPWNNLYYLVFLVVPFSYACVHVLRSWRMAPVGSLCVALACAYAASGYVLPMSVLGRLAGLPSVEMRNLLGHLSLAGIGTLLLLASWPRLEPSRVSE